MNEKNYLLSSFERNFLHKKEQKTAIYGISASTKMILEAFPDFEVCGLLDGNLKKGSLYGKQIIQEEDLLRLGVERVIIIARAASVKIVYNRIKEFCRLHCISIFDVNGVDLAAKYQKIGKETGCFEQSYEDLVAAIDTYDIVSFDIFDTILMRQILKPTDLFLIMDGLTEIPGKRFVFSEERIRAEQEALLGGYPDMDKIYSRMREHTQVDEKQIREWMELEFQLEKRVSLARSRMKDIYFYALSRGKKIFFVSDMYLKKGQLAELLAQQGIEQYEDILVSGQYGVMKTGGLFEVLKQKTGGQTCIHIGDNEEADIAAAKKYGLSSFKIESAYEMMKKSSYRDLEHYTDTLGRRNAVGMLIARVFNDPFKLHGTDGIPRIMEDTDVGYAFVAPIITSYMNVLIKKVAKIHFDGILFQARDGYLLKRLYEITTQGSQEAAPGIYFLTSRLPCLICGIFTENDILKLTQIKYNGSPEQLLEKRFLLRPEEIQSYQVGMGLAEYVLMHREPIFKRAENLREAYRKYASQQGVKKSGRYLFTDLAASGTCQGALEKLLDIDGEGFYLIHIVDESKNKESVIHSLFQIHTWFQKEAFACESYILLENIVTSDRPSVKAFTEEGIPVYGRESRSESQIRELGQIQECIVDYYTLYGQITPSEWVDAHLADKILGLMQPEKSDLRRTSIYSAKLTDDFFNVCYHFDEVLI